MVATISKPMVDPDRIFNGSREWVFGSEPVVEIQHTGPGRDSNPPREVAVKRGRANHITSAVEEQNVTIGA
jgi:hypothetical protein